MVRGEEAVLELLLFKRRGRKRKRCGVVMNDDIVQAYFVEHLEVGWSRSQEGGYSKFNTTDRQRERE